jgi:hypothetical protein
MKPNGRDILSYLANLLADQEGIKIEYAIKGVRYENKNR